MQKKAGVAILILDKIALKIRRLQEIRAPSLARSQNLHLSCLFTHFIEEHVRELGGPLASGMSLRLEVALLAAYLSNL